MARRYMVPINDAELGASQTVDIVTLDGTKKARIKQWRNYLRVRLGTNDVHKMQRVTRALGFRELL